MQTPNQRTVIVLGVLLAAMTLAGGLLLILEPGPVAPLTRISASATSRPSALGQRLFEFNPDVRQQSWTGVTIRFSGARYGSYRSINEQHHSVGLQGAAHHFVIGNGYGAEDGAIEWGFRWRNQLNSPFAPTVDGVAQRPVIDVCLVGSGQTRPTAAQMDELVRLIHNLQRTYDIAPANIELAHGPEGGVPAGFPVARLRQQLLTASR